MRQMVMNLLENDDDMHMMYLTKIFNDPQLAKNFQSFDTDTAESLLEVYLHDIYAMQSRVSLMLHNVQNTESVVMLRLDTKRNYLLTVDLTLTLWTATISVSTFITGCFGMNLNSNIQEVDYLFYIVAFITVFFPIITVLTIKKKLENRGISMSLNAK
ncbi:CorA Metal Ion Transporter (MIT) Family [Thraustotheca clavata]|uniref:CorA Metal Ion Transporter (MIT) Family n=1 Tax=Thraustotheca clavata TaxID=74557 RepID=A0A1V9Z3W8_9STRA|nr:CorA Metal Ion Transporter (MIT) Family [Thraustotheca clavata]